MRFLDARHLLAQSFGIGAVRIVAEGREVIAIVDGVDGVQSILLGKHVIEPERSKVIANRLQRSVERFRNASEIRSRRTGHGPRVDERRDLHELESGSGTRGRGCDQLARQESVAHIRVGNQIHTGLTQMLAKPFVVGEEKCLVFLERSSESRPKLVPPKTGNGLAVEEIARIERVIAQEFIRRPVQLIGPVAGDDQDLGAGPLAEFGAIGISQQVEFLHGVDTQ